MTIHEAELHKRVERYVVAFEELRAAHQDVKDILTDQILSERWRQLGAELGFSAPNPPQHDHLQHDHSPMTQLPEMSDAWS